ncbi:MAG: hypothetical protein ACXVLT_16425 [Flavisolibacter sp.]
MFIIADHFIKDADAFWSTVKNKMDEMPKELHLHAVYPSNDMMRAVCVWDAENVETVDNFLTETFGDVVRNECYKVNVEAAIGLPKAEMV